MVVVTTVAKIESQLVGLHDLTCHSTSTVLQLHSCSVLLCFICFFAIFLPFFLCFLCFSSIVSVFMLGSSVFPLFSLSISLSSINNLPILLTNCVTFLVFTFFHRPTDLRRISILTIGCDFVNNSNASQSCIVI